MSEVEVVLRSARETIGFGRFLADRLRPGDVLLLFGDLGSGKTTFVQGLAEGLDVREPVTSPTFVMIKTYHGRLPLYHMDLFRLSEGEDLGFLEYFEGDGVSAVEWPEAAEAYWPAEALRLYFDGAGESTRTVRVRATGARWSPLLEAIGDAYLGR